MTEKMKKNWPEFVLEILSIITGVCGFGILGIFVYRLLANGFSFTGVLDLDSSSKTGEFVGGVVGSFWTLTSVILLFITLKLQRRGLQESSEAFRRQQFENNFYNLMRTQQEIVNSIEFETKVSGLPKRYNGRKFFRLAETDLFYIHDLLACEDYNEEKSSYSHYKTIVKRYDLSESYHNEVHNKIKDDKQRIITKSYEVLFNRFDYLIGHYFRHLYHILKYLKDSESTDKSCVAHNNVYENYANFIQAQMSTSELFLLFYNSLCFPRMKELVVHYNLLENLPLEDLIEEEHEQLYGKELKSRAITFSLSGKLMFEEETVDQEEDV